MLLQGVQTATNRLELIADTGLKVLQGVFDELVVGVKAVNGHFVVLFAADAVQHLGLLHDQVVYQRRLRILLLRDVQVVSLVLSCCAVSPGRPSS